MPQINAVISLDHKISFNSWSEKAVLVPNPSPVCGVTGVLYLQYREETKQVRMPAEISSQDALRVLFVTAFPHQLTMKMLQSPNTAIYIKDTSRNVYYDLEDMR